MKEPVNIFSFFPKALYFAKESKFDGEEVSYDTTYMLHIIFFPFNCLTVCLKQKGDLPPGRSTTSANTGIPFRDAEIELELDQLRQRAKEF